MATNKLKERTRKIESVLPNVKVISESTKKHYLICRCTIHNYKWEAYVYNLMKASGCPKCKSEKIGNVCRLKIDEVREEYEKRGLKPLFEEYKNNQEKLLCETKEGYKVEISLGHLKNGRKPSIFGRGNPHTVENIKHFIKKYAKGYELLSKEFKNACKDKMIFKCDKNHIFNMSWNSFQQGKRCPECSILRGEKHPFYNPNLSQKERTERRDLQNEKIKQWRLKVYERDSYTCQLCGDNNGGNLNAHHLDGWDWCEERRFDINNGVTLCKICHTEFHKKYGFGKNTKEQFAEFENEYLQHA